jgi:hypothetical protein
MTACATWMGSHLGGPLADPKPTDQRKASAAARSTAACRSSSSKATLRQPSSLVGAVGEPGRLPGRMTLESSSDMGIIHRLS